MKAYNHGECESLAFAAKEMKDCEIRWEHLAPRDLLVNYGYDAMNMAFLFSEKNHGDIPWDEDQIYGFYRMLSRLWDIVQISVVPEKTNNEDSFEMPPEWIALKRGNLSDHMAIATIMRLHHVLRKVSLKDGGVSREILRDYLLFLRKYAPCISYVLWKELGEENSVFQAPLPMVSETEENQPESIAVMVNGKYTGRINLNYHALKEEALAVYVDTKDSSFDPSKIRRVIYEPHHVLSLITEDSEEAHIKKEGEQKA